jgi:NADPH:quinone reductase-like Zn-dependent oxidoreductase
MRSRWRNKERIEATMNTMKAIRIHQYGGPEVLKLEEVPRPNPEANEVLIRVHAAGVNPVDWKIRQGYRKELLGHVLPLIPGWDASGVVEAVGPGVASFKPGDEVYCYANLRRNGAYAEFLVAREQEVALKPQSLDHIRAAAIPVTALTAWQALFDTGALSTCQRVLIHAAAGGVGTAAVQLAKWKGSYIIGTASQRNHEFLKELGVDMVIDYGEQRFEEIVKDADLVFDTIGGETQTRSWAALKKGGVLVSIVGQPSAEEALAHGVRQAYLLVQPNGAQLTQIAKLVDLEKFRPIVQTVLPLAEAHHAHELSQRGHTRGKIVLRVV